MSQEAVDLERRLAEISAKLARLRSVSADTREEVLVATEQLIERALSAHREMVETSRLLRTASANERPGKPARRPRIRR